MVWNWQQDGPLASLVALDALVRSGENKASRYQLNISSMVTAREGDP
jgi:hypothetical protein